MAEAASDPKTEDEPPQKKLKTKKYSPDVLMGKFPSLWYGSLSIKLKQTPAVMYFLCGNPNLARATLPSSENHGFKQPFLRIARRMRMVDEHMDELYKQLEDPEEFCVLIALPFGKNQDDLKKHTDSFRSEVLQYLKSKNSAGIITICPIGATKPLYIIHLFPPHSGVEEKLSANRPYLPSLFKERTYLLVVITKDC